VAAAASRWIRFAARLLDRFGEPLKYNIELKAQDAGASRRLVSNLKFSNPRPRRLRARVDRAEKRREREEPARAAREMNPAGLKTRPTLLLVP
jgi:hypothetical protein